MEQTYVMIKPGFASYRWVVEEVMRRITETAGLRIVKTRRVSYGRKEACLHNIEHRHKVFYDDLVRYFMSDFVVGMIVEGDDAIKKIRSLIGHYKSPAKGTIRYDMQLALGLEFDCRKNVVHASDSKESAMFEIGIFQSLCEGESLIENQA